MDILWRQIRENEKQEVRNAALNHIEQLKQTSLDIIEQMVGKLGGDLQVLSDALAELRKARVVNFNSFPFRLARWKQLARTR